MLVSETKRSPCSFHDSPLWPWEHLRTACQESPAIAGAAEAWTRCSSPDTGMAIWSLVPLPFLKPAWTSGSSWFIYCWSLNWRILNITSIWDECNCTVFWTFFGIAFLWDWNENWPFPVLWPLLLLLSHVSRVRLLSFPNLLAYWVQHFHSIIFQGLK